MFGVSRHYTLLGKLGFFLGRPFCRRPVRVVHCGNQGAWDDLPVKSETVAAPTAIAFRPAIGDKCVPVAVGFVLVDGADLAAWTSTCHSVTTVEQPKRMERAWGKVKSVFGGKPAQAEVHTDCQGHYTIRLREPEQVQALERPDERTAVVLVRDVTLPTLPDSG